MAPRTATSGTHLPMDIDDGAEQTPRAALSVDMQHAQNLQETNTSESNKTAARHNPLPGYAVAPSQRIGMMFSAGT